VLLIIAFFRELLGSGHVWGYKVIFGRPGWWVNWSIMVMAPGAFFMLAIFIWIVKGYVLNKPRRRRPSAMKEFTGLLAIFFAAIFTNNILLTNYLGMCSFLAVSREVKTSSGWAPPWCS
jgi:Na+-transporting NADH:ubiquinone oxidoreductase subunit NqrD